LSPSDISFFQIDPATNQVIRSGDSPYHGDYPIYTPLFLNESQTLLFTASGNYFRTDNLAYAGKLVGADSVRSLSHHAASEELLVLSSGLTTLPGTYQRYTGSLLLPESDLLLPTVSGQPSYGLGIFHSAAGRHVALVQTVTNELRGAGARYHLVVR
jgi:hypothetical protein